MYLSKLQTFLTLLKKQIKDGIVENSNKLVTNLSSCELSSKEIKILKLGLRYGVATCLVDSKMFVILEDTWDQIKNGKAIKNESEQNRTVN